MAVNRVNHRGKSRIEVRRRWPDGTTFRRFYPNMTKANQIFHRIEASIFDGTWPELKRRLAVNGDSETPTIEEFAKCFLNEYAKPRLRSWRRYEESLRSLIRLFGKLRLDQLQRGSLFPWMKRRNGESPRRP